MKSLLPCFDTFFEHKNSDLSPSGKNLKLRAVYCDDDDLIINIYYQKGEGYTLQIEKNGVTLFEMSDKKYNQMISLFRYLFTHPTLSFLAILERKTQETQEAQDQDQDQEEIPARCIVSYKLLTKEGYIKERETFHFSSFETEILGFIEDRLSTPHYSSINAKRILVKSKDQSLEITIHSRTYSEEEKSTFELRFNRSLNEKVQEGLCCNEYEFIKRCEKGERYTAYTICGDLKRNLDLYECFTRKEKGEFGIKIHDEYISYSQLFQRIFLPLSCEVVRWGETLKIKEFENFNEFQDFLENYGGEYEITSPSKLEGVFFCTGLTVTLNRALSKKEIEALINNLDIDYI